jgi:CBS domain-containing protein/tetratricopeptide (TPR) repeat protein
MGVVFSAVDLKSAQRVAVKRLLPNPSAEVAAFFEREYAVLSSLKHPRIIEVYEYGVDVEGAYYTMELLDGTDLAELAPLDVPLACRYLRDVASSLALLHARRLIHRDVSPRNVRTARDGGCKLLDFGVLMSFGVSHDVVGTPPMLAPESLFGQPLDQRADLYSLGALAYWLLTARHAYPAGRVHDLMQLWEQKPAAPSRHRQDIPPELDQLVLALLSVEPIARPRTADEVIDQLNVIGGLEPDHDQRTPQAYFTGAALVERDGELEEARRGVQSVRHGHGAALFIESEPGVGKSRMLAEIMLRAQLSGVAVLHADAALETGTLGTARALLRRLARIAPGAAAKVAGPRLAVFGTVWPELADELGARPDTATYSEHERAAARDELPSILEACLLAASTKLPLCIAIDDAHRADPESATLLLKLARSTNEHRIFLVAACAAVPDEKLPLPIRAVREVSTRLPLRELSEAGVTALVRGAFGDVPHVKRTATRLFGATDGNPQHCMTLLQHWARIGIIGYQGGVWLLPLDIPNEALLQGARVARDRLLRCTPAARHMAEVLSVLERPAPLSLCAALARDRDDAPSTILVLEELVQAEILVQSAAGYRFRQEGFRTELARSLQSARSVALHELCANVVLASAPDNPDSKLEAGSHLIQAGQESRGADLIAKAAREVLAQNPDPGRLLAAQAPALESALATYRRQQRSNIRLLDLLVPLVVASHHVSREFALRYGPETIGRLERALGLPERGAAEGADPVGFDRASVLRALTSAPVLDDGEEPSLDTPDVVLLVTWLIRSVMTLVTVAATAIDRELESRFAAALAPFVALGEQHPAAVAYRFCEVSILLTEDCPAKAHRVWSTLLAELQGLGLPEAMKRRLEASGIMALGFLESHLDDDSVLARLEQLEKSAHSHAVAAANQLRFIYHGYRGEVDVAEKYRDRVELYAAERGTAWQVEVWATCTFCAVYGHTRDAAGVKRTVAHLARLKQGIESLEPFWEQACATYLMLSGEPRRAAELFEATLAKTKPRERAGWAAVRGALAQAYNQLGEHAQALRIGEETVVLAAEDRDFVGMTLNAWLELCEAHAGLGQLDRAKEILDELFARFGAHRNPMTLGSLHRVRAHVALREGDEAGFEHHLTQMEAWFRSTSNPVLVAQCDKLRNLAAREHNQGTAPAPPIRDAEPLEREEAYEETAFLPLRRSRASGLGPPFSAEQDPATSSSVKNPLVRDIMTKPVLTADADWSLEELKGFLLEHDISGAPVTDKGKLVGVVSSTDLLRTEATERASGGHEGYFSTSLDRPLAPAELRTMHIEGGSAEAVRDVMTPVVFQVPDDTRVDEVADMMARGRIHRVVVTTRGRVSGIVSALDLVTVLRDALRSE